MSLRHSALGEFASQLAEKTKNMAITGNIKIFKKSFGDIDFDDATSSVSTGSTLKDSVRDRRRHTKWQSFGSDDLTTETVTLVFGSEKSMNRLLIVNHNLKAYTAKYWNGSAWTHFANVVTKEGSQANITETTNTKTTNYYEFTEVATDRIQISATACQTADAEKYIGELIATKEIGTFTGWPIIQQGFNRLEIEKRSLRGMPKYSILDEQYAVNLVFQNYPTSADHSLISSLYDTREEFLFYPCGGNESQFRYSLAGFRLQDIYLVHMRGDYAPNFDHGIYILPLSYQVNLVEVL